jgi:predicted homoserine dehydrogenase-like protein
MNLHALLRNRAADGEPIRVGVVGAGKFGTMFLAQARTTPGMHVAAIADLAESRARRAMGEAGFEEKHSSARSVADALASGTTHITEDAEVLISAEGIEVVVEATGSPSAGVRHALLAFGHGCHVIMVNEASPRTEPHIGASGYPAIPGAFERDPEAAPCAAGCSGLSCRVGFGPGARRQT